MTAPSQHPAIVLRTVRYGDADVICHLFTADAGRRGAIAKGARRAKSRIGVRIEPFMVLQVMLRQGRGDLAIVQGAEVVEAHETIRSSYLLQQAAAVAFDTLGRLSVEHAVSADSFHLTCSMLRALDGIDAHADDAAPAVARLLLAYHLKLLHVSGLAPALGTCVRCGAEEGLASFSARDGGLVCGACREPGDVAIEPDVRECAAWATREPLARVAGAGEGVPGDALVRASWRILVTGMCAEHAGFRPRSIAHPSA